MFRDAEVFDCDEGAFFGNDEADEVEEAHSSPNVGAGGDDDGAISGCEEVVAAEVGIGLDPRFLLLEEGFDGVGLCLVDAGNRAVEVEGGELDCFDRIVFHGDLVFDDFGVEDHLPRRVHRLVFKVVFVDAEAEQLPFEGDGETVVGVEEVADEVGIDAVPEVQLGLVDLFEEFFLDEDIDGVVGRDDEVVAFSASRFEFDDELFVGGVIAHVDLDAGLFLELRDNRGIEDVAPCKNVEGVFFVFDDLPGWPIEPKGDEGDPEEDDSGADK